MAGTEAKKALIAEVMGRLEKLGKDKYWLRDEILRRSPKLPVVSGMMTYEMLQECQMSLLSQLDSDLKKSEAQAEYTIQ